MTATIQTRSLTTTETAKLIRRELKAAFPATKFSVRSDSYSGGSSIRISWIDGPSAAAVENVSNKYEGRGFDGMIDLSYYINAWVLNGEIIGTRCSGTTDSGGIVSPWGMIPPHDDAELVSLSGSFVQTTRRISPAFARRMMKQIAEYWGGVTYIPEVTEGYDGAYAMVNDADYRIDIRDDVRMDWSTAIHQASVDATRFNREAR